MAVDAYYAKNCSGKFPVSARVCAQWKTNPHEDDLICLYKGQEKLYRLNIFNNIFRYPGISRVTIERTQINKCNNTHGYCSGLLGAGVGDKCFEQAYFHPSTF